MEVARVWHVLNPLALGPRELFLHCPLAGPPISLPPPAATSTSVSTSFQSTALSGASASVSASAPPIAQDFSASFPYAAASSSQTPLQMQTQMHAFNPMEVASPELFVQSMFGSTGEIKPLSRIIVECRTSGAGAATRSPSFKAAVQSPQQPLPTAREDASPLPLTDRKLEEVLIGFEIDQCQAQPHLADVVATDADPPASAAIDAGAPAPSAPSAFLSTVSTGPQPVTTVTTVTTVSASSAASASASADLIRVRTDPLDWLRALRDRIQYTLHSAQQLQ